MSNIIKFLYEILKLNFNLTMKHLLHPKCCAKMMYMYIQGDSWKVFV